MRTPKRMRCRAYDESIYLKFRRIGKMIFEIQIIFFFLI